MIIIKQLVLLNAKQNKGLLLSIHIRHYQQVTSPDASKLKVQHVIFIKSGPGLFLGICNV